MASRNTGRVLAGIYALLLVAAAVYAGIRFFVSPGTSELVAMAFVLLGLPWTLAVPFLLRAGGSSAWLAVAGIGAACLLNFWLLSRVGSKRR